MIKITVSGFKSQIAEFETQNQVLLFLTELKQEHNDFLAPLIRNIPYNVGKRNSGINIDKVMATQDFMKDVRKISKANPLKIHIEEFDDDMSGLI